MAKMIQFTILDTLTPGIKRYAIAFNQVNIEAMGKVALQLLNFIVNGSPLESRIPPILTGTLRGSGSAFVGNKLIGTTIDNITFRKKTSEGTPNRAHSDRRDIITVGFNTIYAARMHEETWNPGRISARDPAVGNKFVEKHLMADGKLLMKMYARLLDVGLSI